MQQLILKKKILEVLFHTTPQVWHGQKRRSGNSLKLRGWLYLGFIVAGLFVPGSWGWKNCGSKIPLLQQGFCLSLPSTLLPGSSLLVTILVRPGWNFFYADIPLYHPLVHRLLSMEGMPGVRTRILLFLRGAALYDIVFCQSTSTLRYHW